MWIGDKVIYTPEIVTVTKGDPVEAEIESMGTDDMVTIVLANGDKERVEKRLCVKPVQP